MCFYEIGLLRNRYTNIARHNSHWRLSSTRCTLEPVQPGRPAPPNYRFETTLPCTQTKLPSGDNRFDKTKNRTIWKIAIFILCFSSSSSAILNRVCRLGPCRLASASSSSGQQGENENLGENGTKRRRIRVSAVDRGKPLTALDLVSLRRGAVRDFKTKICYGTGADKGTRTRTFTVSDTEFGTNHCQTYCITVNNSISSVVPLL